MTILKQFAAAVALGAITSTAAIAQEAVPPHEGAPEGQEQPEVPPQLKELFGQMFGMPSPEEEVCYSLDEYMDKLKQEANEDYVMDQYYDGKKMPKGHYTITAAPDTGSWTLIFDPEGPNSEVFNTSCDGEHDVFHLDGNNYGYPFAVEGMPEYGEIFGKPLRHLTKFEESKPTDQFRPPLKFKM